MDAENIEQIQDIEALRSIAANALQTIKERTDVLALKESELQEKTHRIQTLEEYIRLIQRKRFAPKSEVHPGQTDFFDLLDEAELIQSVEPIEDTDTEVSRKNKSKPGRRKLPDHLPRVKIYHDLPESEKTCGCGCQLKAIDDVISEQLEIIPQSIQVIQHCRKKYVCTGCEGQVVTAPLPPQPIPKSNASPSTLAHVIVAKFLDGLPLYRQERAFERLGTDISRATLANWVIQASELVIPLMNLIQEHILAGSIIQADETTIQVLKEPGYSPTGKKYMWVLLGGSPEQPAISFEYNPSRGQQVPLQLLEGYEGYLQTDGYAGYNQVCLVEAITRLACWDHVRRKFKEARDAEPKTVSAKHSKSEQALMLIRKLYKIERRIKDYSPEQKKAIRQNESIPQLKKIHAWMTELIPQVTPKSLLGKALHYTKKLWDALIVYCQDGRLDISNQAAENSIRPFAIARKNFLFADTSKGAHASARLYSLIMNAKLNGLNPYLYLKHVFKELPAAETVEDIEKLLPWRVAL